MNEKEGEPYSYHAPPAHSSLDQEWICLEEDLSALTDYFIAALEGNESKSTLRRMWHQETGVIRSRVRSRPLSDMCMKRNGAQGQQCQACVDGHDVKCSSTTCPIEAQPQDAAGKADLIPILMYCRNIINTDKSGLAMALDRIRRVAKGYAWIPLNEWGSYEYTERTTTTLQKEVGFMLQEIDNIADLALKESGERVNVHIREIEKGVAELRTTPASPGKAYGDVLAELEVYIKQQMDDNKVSVRCNPYDYFNIILEKIAALRQVQQP